MILYAKSSIFYSKALTLKDENNLLGKNTPILMILSYKRWLIAFEVFASMTIQHKLSLTVFCDTLESFISTPVSALFCLPTASVQSIGSNALLFFHPNFWTRHSAACFMPVLWRVQTNKFAHFECSSSKLK